jgi:glycosyltransferase involved in cell wall biosynthesis
VGLLLREKFGLPLVVSLRGSDVNVYPYRDRWTFRLTRKVISEADGLAAVSGALKSAAEKIARPRNDIAVVYTGCDLERFSFDEELRKKMRHRLGILPESPALIFIGHILRAKGILELLDAFFLVRQSHPDLHLIVIGSGEDFSTFKGKVAHGAGYIHVLGSRPHDEIPGWLSAADILVLPSWREGLPNVVVEAIACERPVVATRVGGIPEAVIDNESGILVDKQDPQALAEAINFLLLESEARKKMGTRGRHIVEEKFTWEKNAERTIEVYREVLGAS